MARRVALLLVTLGFLGACEPDTVVHKVGWFATMRHQRNIKPYARPIPPVAGTVPVDGAELPLTRETADRLVNPRTRTAESLNRGQWVYQTYVASLVDPSRSNMTDGAIYGMIVEAQRMGRGLMPRYGDKIHGNDRWDLVNYVRSLQLNARAGQ